QRARAVTKILQRVLDERDAELVSGTFSDLLHAPEPQEGSPASLVRRHAGSQVLLDLLIEVKADLFIEASFEGVATGQRSQPVPELSHPGHSGPPVVARHEVG